LCNFSLQGRYLISNDETFFDSLEDFFGLVHGSYRLFLQYSYPTFQIRDSAGIFSVGFRIIRLDGHIRGLRTSGFLWHLFMIFLRLPALTKAKGTVQNA
jgi:hypothetical protein